MATRVPEPSYPRPRSRCIGPCGALRSSSAPRLTALRHPRLVDRVQPSRGFSSWRGPCNSIIRFSALAAACLAAAPAIAQTAYRCTDANGRNVYQQTACTGDQAQRTYRHRAEPVPTPRQYQFNDAPAPEPAYHYQAPQPATLAAHAAPAVPYADRTRQIQNAARSMRGSLSGREAAMHAAAQGASPALQRELERIARDSAYRGSPSARRAAMNAAMANAGIAPAGAYRPPQPPQPPQPLQAPQVGHPATVIDPRTGAPINGANGVIMVGPNRAWNPRTGEYFDTAP